MAYQHVVVERIAYTLTQRPAVDRKACCVLAQINGLLEHYFLLGHNKQTPVKTVTLLVPCTSIILI